MTEEDETSVIEEITEEETMIGIEIETIEGETVSVNIADGTPIQVLQAETADAVADTTVIASVDVKTTDAETILLRNVAAIILADID